jgi:hypothetical protein
MVNIFEIVNCDDIIDTRIASAEERNIDFLSLGH